MDKRDGMQTYQEPEAVQSSSGSTSLQEKYKELDSLFCSQNFNLSSGSQVLKCGTKSLVRFSNVRPAGRVHLDSTCSTGAPDTARYGRTFEIDLIPPPHLSVAGK